MKNKLKFLMMLALAASIGGVSIADDGTYGGSQRNTQGADGGSDGATPPSAGNNTVGSDRDEIKQRESGECSGAALQTYFENSASEPALASLLADVGITDPTAVTVSSLQTSHPTIYQSVVSSCNSSDICLTDPVRGRCVDTPGGGILTDNLLNPTELYNSDGVLQDLITSGSYGIPSGENGVFCGGQSMSELRNMAPAARRAFLQACRAQMRNLSGTNRRTAMASLFNNPGNIGGSGSNGGGPVHNNGGNGGSIEYNGGQEQQMHMNEPPGTN